MHGANFRSCKQSAIAKLARDRVAECIDLAIDKPRAERIALLDAAMELDSHASQVTRQLPVIA